MAGNTGRRISSNILVLGLCFSLFFLGYISWRTVDDRSINQEPLAQVVALFLTIISVIGLSYGNHSPLEGMITGASISTTYWVGFLMRTIEIFREPRLGSLSYIEVIQKCGSGALSSVLAFCFMGLFFGLLGYMYDGLFMEKPVEEAYVFRDYWSNVYYLGKNRRREISDLDQNLAFRVPWSIDVHEWWRRITRKITEKKPELLFNRVKKGAAEADDPRSFEVGDVYDIGSGKRIVEDVIDPLYLLAGYRPSVMSMPSLTHSIGGGRRLAFEELVTRLLGWFIGSRYLMYVYQGLSLVSSGFIIHHYREEFIDIIISRGTLESIDLMHVSYVLGSCVIVSGLTLFFILRWRGLSSKLFEKRPDERTLIFSVYLCFILSYWMSYQFITDPPYINIDDGFSGSWLTWAKWFLVLSIILGISYTFIHRESEVSNIYLYDGRGRTDESDSDISPYRSIDDAPFWVKADGELFWVLRYMYYWPMELTMVPHPDWERIEVWVDAYSGEVKWVVSDYHYRELWYRVEEDLRNRLTAGFLINFHTPIPLVKTEDVQAITQSISKSAKSLMRMVLTGSSGVKDAPYERVELNWHHVHEPNWIKDFGLKGPAADFCSNLKWSYWRYPWGIDDVERYVSHPAALRDEQPKHIKD